MCPVASWKHSSKYVTSQPYTPGDGLVDLQHIPNRHSTVGADIVAAQIQDSAAHVSLESRHEKLAAWS